MNSSGNDGSILLVKWTLKVSRFNDGLLVQINFRASYVMFLHFAMHRFLILELLSTSDTVISSLNALLSSVTSDISDLDFVVSIFISRSTIGRH